MILWNLTRNAGIKGSIQWSIYYHHNLYFVHSSFGIKKWFYRISIFLCFIDIGKMIRVIALWSEHDLLLFGIRFWIVAVELENLQRFGVCNVSATVSCLDSAKMMIILYVNCCKISAKMGIIQSIFTLLRNLQTFPPLKISPLFTIRYHFKTMNDWKIS